MKKNIAILISVLLFLCCMFGCSSEETTEDLDALLKAKAESAVNDYSTTTDEQPEVADPDIFVSVWPDELPRNHENHFDPGRPIQYDVQLEDGSWTAYWDYTSMYLYDFPDPEPGFHKFGTTFIYEKKEIIFKYDKLKKSEDEGEDKEEISREDFNSFIDALTEAGYTDNSERTETTYYCEKYGVSITIVLTDEFPFVDDDSRLHPFKTLVDCCYVRLQLIDPDYEMNLEEIKAEEYRKWLENH